MSAKITGNAPKPHSGNSAKIGGGPRKVPVDKQMVEMINPETKEIVPVSRANANDLQNHLGWKPAAGRLGRIRPGDVKLANGEVIDDNSPSDANAPGVETEGPGTVPTEDDDDSAKQSAEDKAKATAVAEMTDLRAKLEELGVEVDKRWGKATLKAELEKAEAAFKTLAPTEGEAAPTEGEDKAE